MKAYLCDICGKVMIRAEVLIEAKRDDNPRVIDILLYSSLCLNCYLKKVKPLFKMQEIENEQKIPSGRTH